MYKYNKPGFARVLRASNEHEVKQELNTL